MYLLIYYLIPFTVYQILFYHILSSVYEAHSSFHWPRNESYNFYISWQHVKSFWLLNLTFTFMSMSFLMFRIILPNKLAIYSRHSNFLLCYYTNNAIILSGGKLQFLASPLMFLLLLCWCCFFFNRKYSNYKAFQFNNLSLSNKCKKYEQLFFHSLRML